MLNATRAVAVASCMHVAPSAHPTIQPQQLQTYKLRSTKAHAHITLSPRSPVVCFPCPCLSDSLRQQCGA